MAITGTELLTVGQKMQVLRPNLHEDMWQAIKRNIIFNTV